MSIDFKSTKAIFLQIADNICQRILDGTLHKGDRIPSVRDLAAEFEVNRNTVLRTCALLDESGVFENRRGIGFFVSENALQVIQKREREAFFRDDLPQFINKVKLLQLNLSEITELTNVINNIHHNESK